jgi:hypothetical protein
MATRTYKGKHAKPPAYAGSTPRGPQRWARAADNALRAPNSQAAKLFFDRVSTAHRVRTDFPNTDGPFGHYEIEYLGWDRETQRVIEGGRMKRKYVTCSLFCCAMVVQLDRQFHGYDELVRFLTDSEQSPRALRHGELKRPASCQFCGTKVQA